MPVSEEVYAEGRRSLQETRSSQAQRYRAPTTMKINEAKRFFLLWIGVHACICASAGYVYNLFSGELQQKYNYTQAQLSTITTMSSIICIVVFPLAGVYDYFGPRPLFLVGMISFPLGAIAFGLAFNDVIRGSVARFTVFNALLGIGTSMFDISGLMTIMSIFPSSRGAVIAVMKTFIGIGAAIFGSIQLGFFETSISHFFYFMAAYVGTVGFLCVLFVELPPYQLTGYDEKNLTDAEKAKKLSTKKAYLEKVPPLRRFAIGFVLVALLIIVLPLQSTLIAYKNLDHEYKRMFATVTVVILGCYCIIALPIRLLDVGSANILEQLPEEDEESIRAQLSGRRMTATQRLSMRINSARASIAEQAIFNTASIDEAEHIAPQYQTTFWESVATRRLWALSYSLFCIFGTQMVIIVNARFVYAAASETTMTQDMASLLTVFNGAGSAIGRIIMSIFEVWTQKRKPEERIPLTIALFIPSSIMLTASVLLLCVSKEWLLIPFGLTALGNGFSAATVVLVMRTMYARDVANHYNFMSIASLAATVLLNQMLYGAWYTKEAEKQHNGGTLCKGRQCIFVPFAVMSGLLVTSMFSNLYVHLQYKSYCREVLAERAQLAGDRRTTAPNTDTNSDERAPLLES